MRLEAKEKLFKIIRKVVIDGERDIPEVRDMKSEELDALFALAGAHQMKHILSFAFYTGGEVRFAKSVFSSARQTAAQEHAARVISDAFLQNEIPFVLLKGAVIRQLYPEGWMRNSCDVDVLVHDTDLDAANEALTARGFARLETLSSHDVAYSFGTVHIELHYALIEEHVMSAANSILEGVWDRLSKTESGELVMPDDMLYFYHVAHMAKHFQHGGCGIRSILDLWMLNHRTSFDGDARDRLLRQGELLKFEREMRRLSEYWFSDGVGDGLEVIEAFVLTGGAYGRVDSGVSLMKSQSGGRVKYIFKRLFAPYSMMVRYYPVLKKHPYLLPIYYVKRCIGALRRDKSRYFFELNESLKRDENAEKVAEMLKTLGL